MSTSRLEAFSDGVIAIIITIMVLEFRTPGGSNHHHLIHAALAFVGRRIAVALYVSVALIWLVPDRRIESLIAGDG